LVTAVGIELIIWIEVSVGGDCMVIGADVTILVNYFRGSGVLSYCPDYIPAWPPLPPSAPAGWPNCVPPLINSSDSNELEMKLKGNE